jgi:sortase A
LALIALSIFRFQVAEDQQLKKLEQQSNVTRTEAAPTPAPGDLLGKLSIPRIGLSAIVAEGVDTGTLRRAVGHIPGTAIPEESGNVALAGHRDTFFRDLGRVRMNDIIDLETPAGAYQYRVMRTAVVGPQDVELLQSSAGPELTLITCYPFHNVGPAPERFVVQAMRVTASGDTTPGD